MFSVAMSLLVLRSPTPQVAAALSGMAQGVGYFIAALAPLMVGVLHELTGDWNAVIAFMVFLIVCATWSGLLAGRRSEEHTSELQSLMSLSSAVFCLENTKTTVIFNVCY